ncbi:uncharacterized protein LOC110461434 [Mizuhopecten yessoensis]|uniref:2-aminoethylphosphonate--pyruvate transaminase n=1 Tax=Mizuhopecten yessoensis TaxID=6573 RepID=A0A210Q0A6_MIZYE|nr:uncharacterized protein LOC110461434 [Mizuhopecten yessoensis]OWF42181.1 2-aminoethylphosphonate--pyruvate transaminase [Mizuhopecten yessoensis]
MTHMQKKVVEFISKKPSDRKDIIIQIFLPWLRKKSLLLQDLDKAILTDVMRNCAYQKANRDDLIITQGELGDSFYIMLTGKTSVYITPIKVDDEQQSATPDMQKKGKDDEKTDDNDDSSQEEEENTDEKKPLDRSKFGKFIMHYEGSNSFGEVALMSEDSVRNATIIADEETDLLVISRELFNRSVKAKQEKEYEEKKDFINESPFFHNWSPKFKRLLEMSIRKEHYPFGSTIVRQGDSACGLVFLLSGQAKVTVNPSHHNGQFPLLTKQEINPIAKEIGRNSYNKIVKKLDRNFTQHHIQIRRKEGYAAAEKRVMSRTVELCCIESNDVIGDIEMVMELERSTCTVNCTENTTVMVLDTKNYDRLIAKKNIHTIRKLCKTALQKVMCRASSGKGSQVPLLDILQKKLQEKLPSKDENNCKAKIDRSKSVAMEQLIQFFLKDKAPLIEPCVPNSLYYRIKSEKRAKMIEINEMKLKGHVSKVENRLYDYRPRRKVPRSMKQLKSMRAENDLLRTTQSAWDYPQVSHTSLRPRTALGIHREFSQSPTSRPHTAGIFHLTECNNAEEEAVGSPTRDEPNGVVSDVLEQIDLVQKEKTEARSKVICSAMAVSEINKTSMRNGGSSTSALTAMEPFDEDYFDWETSERNLCNLEDRIKHFCSDGENKPVKVAPQVAPLRRFSIRDEKEDDSSFDVKVPKPGGTVFIKSKPCHLPPNANIHPDGHQHVRRFVVTRDEAYDFSSMLSRRPKSARPTRTIITPTFSSRRPKTATGGRTSYSRTGSLVQMIAS